MLIMKSYEFHATGARSGHFEVLTENEPPELIMEMTAKVVTY